MRPILFELGGVPLYGYGVMQIFAALAFVGLVALGKQRFGATGDALARTGLAAVVGGAVGSKVLFVLVNLDAKVPLSSLLTSGGFVATGNHRRGDRARHRRLPVAGRRSARHALLRDGRVLARLERRLSARWLLRGQSDGASIMGPTLSRRGRANAPVWTASAPGSALLDGDRARDAWRDARLQAAGGGERALVGIVMLLVWRAIAEGTVADPTRPVMAMVMVGLAVLAALANVVLRLRRPATAR